MQKPSCCEISQVVGLIGSSSSTQECDSFFDKYRLHPIPGWSAFRLYSTDVSCEEFSDSSMEEGSGARGTYRKYTMKEKEEAVQKIINGHDVKQVSKEFGIPKRNLIRWRKNGCERKEGGGRPTDHQLETILYDKIRKNQIRGQKEIRAAAIEVSRTENFKASKGWFSKFCRRYKARTGNELARV